MPHRPAALRDAKQIRELTCRAGGRDGVEIRFACTDYLFPDVCSRTAADVDRQGGGRRGSRCADLLRRDDGPTQMRRATAKATCSRRAELGPGTFAKAGEPS